MKQKESLIKYFDITAHSLGYSKKIISNKTNTFIDKTKNLGTTVVEEAPNGSLISYDVYTRLLKDRVIFFGHPVMDEVTNVAVAQLLFLEMTDAKRDITMYLNSPGGSTVAGKSLIDVMEYIVPDVSVVNIGMCASMGAVILACGAKSKRYALKSAKTMIHQVSTGMEGKSSDITVNYEQMIKEENSLYTILSEKSGQKFDLIKEKCKLDYWMNPTEAKDFGLIDDILTKRQTTN